jgi:hypothetical protein
VLKKKVLKVLPVWLVALLLIGSAAAAFMWISNRLSTYVIISERSIELTGSFEASPFKDEVTSQAFSYTIHNMSDSSGYIYLEFTTYGPAITTSDIECSLFVEPIGGTTMYSALVAGYPNQTYTNQVTFLFELDTGGPFDFSDAGFTSDGYIHVYVTYKTATGLTAAIQITSTSS